MRQQTFDLIAQSEHIHQLIIDLRIQSLKQLRLQIFWQFADQLLLQLLISIQLFNVQKLQVGMYLHFELMLDLQLLHI